eukprot:1651245-Amphidinium_carterae.3
MHHWIGVQSPGCSSDTLNADSLKLFTPGCKQAAHGILHQHVLLLSQSIQDFMLEWDDGSPDETVPAHAQHLHASSPLAH